MRSLTCCIAIALVSGAVQAVEESVQFNTDVLDVQDRANIDLGQFSRAGYVMPGTYTMAVNVNKASLPEESVTFLAPEDNPKDSVACLSRALVERFGLKEDILRHLTWWHNGECLDTHAKILDGMTVQGSLATSSLDLTIPQAYLEYTSESWDPPSRWDDGVPGLLADYYAGVQTTQGKDETDYSVSGNGTLGANLGAWRFRADWQASRANRAGVTRQQWQWSRYYLFRTIRSLRAKMVIGEDFLNSGLFDNPRFTGVRLYSDDNQLPPNLRGYAPEVTGIARTNASVTISQQGRVIYQTQVAPGPFRIQALNDATSGTLDVVVQEQDGSEQRYQVNTATIPYLTRPGMVRYKLATGRPSDIQHRTNGPAFATGEFSWGINNGWSLFGGGMFGNNYNSLSVGAGRDLLALGAMSFDVSTSRAQLARQGVMIGNSYRLSYSKTFESLDSQVTFAGYRFSERAYMSLSEFLAARQWGEKTGGSKEKYTVSLNKQFRSIGLSSYLNVSRQTYWNNRPADIHYSLSLSKIFDIGTIKNISLALSLFRNQYQRTWDKGGFLSLSMPMGDHDSLSYSAIENNGQMDHRVGYSSVLNEYNSYQLSVGSGEAGASANASFNHEGDMAEMTASAGYLAGRYSSASLSARGGITATSQGAAMHRINQAGGTRLMLGTDGVSGVPVRGFGRSANTNFAGIAVITDVNSYYRNKASVDLAHLADDADVTGSASVTEATLTDGAIGYRHFDVLSGKKSMAVINLASGEPVPFGAIVMNRKEQQTGMVGDMGNTWLSGMNAGEKMDVYWNGKAQCTITLPEQLDAPSLLLPCILNRELQSAGKHSEHSQKYGEEK